MGNSSSLSNEAKAYLKGKSLNLDGLLGDLDQHVVRVVDVIELQDIPPEKRKIALAISGGGASGAYEAGVLEALLRKFKEKNLNVDLLVGTSAGALNTYAVFLEKMGKHNSQLSKDSILEQPYKTFVASLWSYLDQKNRASKWIVGRRSWLVQLATRWLQNLIFRRIVVTVLVLLAGALNPFLSVYLNQLIFKGEGVWGAFRETWDFPVRYPDMFRYVGLGSLAIFFLLLVLLVLTFRFSLFKNLPLLRLLVNAKDGGDFRKNPRWGRRKTENRARVSSRCLVSDWYQGMKKLPEMIVTGTDLTLGSECLFTLVYPSTYLRLVDCDWMTIWRKPCSIMESMAPFLPMQKTSFAA